MGNNIFNTNSKNTNNSKNTITNPKYSLVSQIPPEETKNIIKKNKSSFYPRPKLFLPKFKEDIDI